MEQCLKAQGNDMKKALLLALFGTSLTVINYSSAGQFSNSFTGPGADDCAFYQLQAGTGVPATNFVWTKVTVTYFGAAGCSGISVLGPVDITDTTTITLPQDHGFNPASCALVAYRSGSVLTPTDPASDIKCITLQAFGRDSNGNARSTNTQQYDVSCIGIYPNVSCTYTTTIDYPLQFN